jgi:hypothetical protein
MRTNRFSLAIMGRILGNIYFSTNPKPANCFLLFAGGRTDICQRHFCWKIFSGLGIEIFVLPLVRFERLRRAARILLTNSRPNMPNVVQYEIDET